MIVQVVSPFVKYSLFVSTTRVTLQEVINVMQDALNKQNIKKNFLIVVVCLKFGGSQESKNSRYLMCSPAEAEQSPQTIIYSSFDFCEYKVNTNFLIVQIF